jgi:hypothetical protein
MRQPDAAVKHMLDKQAVASDIELVALVPASVGGSDVKALAESLLRGCGDDSGTIGGCSSPALPESIHEVTLSLTLEHSYVGVEAKRRT